MVLNEEPFRRIDFHRDSRGNEKVVCNWANTVLTSKTDDSKNYCRDKLLFRYKRPSAAACFTVHRVNSDERRAISLCACVRSVGHATETGHFTAGRDKHHGNTTHTD